MYIYRNIHYQINNHLKKKEYTIITGPRQCGKTSLIKALSDELTKQGEIVSYISFEDPTILSAINKHPEEVFSFAIRPANGKSKDKKRIYLFIDEVQYAADPSNFLKYLYDTYEEELKVIATGSSAFYIDSKFKDSLAGRKRIFELRTLDFDEWLLFNGFLQLKDELENIRTQKDYFSSVSKELLDNFNNYLIYGGYPAVVLENDVQEKIYMLNEIKSSFLKRDIQESGVSSIEKFYNLLAILAQQPGNLVNKNELANTIGVDNKTIERYLFILQKSFHISLLRPFYSNIRKEITKMPKVYFNDSGMINIILNRFYDFNIREDKGALFENYIYRRLSRVYDSSNIKFWRTADKKEIDFVITTSFNQGLAYEAKVNCRDIKNSVLDKFTNNYPNYPVSTVSYNISENCKWVFKI